jgi:DMSO/TMAO reductase YedYZ molybdopterin-dependent catalytic subunit
MDTIPVVDGLATAEALTFEELRLAARNHGMPLEGLRYDVTPIGMHYLLIHFDVPEMDASTWSLEVGGRVRRPLRLSMADIGSRPAVTLTATMECAGNGRAALSPRPVSQPWLSEAIGTAEWTGTPLAPILEEAGLEDDVVELVFTGADRGVQGDVEHPYERSLTVEEAARRDVLLAYRINGQPLPPQHGFPLRLLVPGWYGMTSVKWLTRITAVADPFDGFQMDAYRFRGSPDDPGSPVTRMQPRALMIPPGIPEFLSRVRLVPPGPQELRGRGWSGWGAIERVEVSIDDGPWRSATLGTAPGPHAWVPWRFDWVAEPGDHVLRCRATDDAGNTQPESPPWNHGGFQNNAPQAVAVTVRATADRI